MMLSQGEAIPDGSDISISQIGNGKALEFIKHVLLGFERVCRVADAKRCSSDSWHEYPIFAPMSAKKY